MQAIGLFISFLMSLIFLVGAALIVYVLILLIQVLRLSIQALRKYLQG